MVRRFWAVCGLLVVGGTGLACGQSTSGGHAGRQLTSGDHPGGGSGVPGPDGGQPSPRPTDAGTDGGALAEACAELVREAPGAPVRFQTGFLSHHDASGDRGTTDLSGDVLIPLIGGHFDTLTLFILDPAGVVLSNPPAVGGNSFGRAAIGVADGFIGVQNLDVSQPSGFPAHRVAKVFPDGGADQTEFDAGLASQAEDPRGGMAVLVSQTKTLTAYDSNLGVRWQALLPITDWDPLTNTERLPVGVDTGGNSLVLFDGPTSVEGIWTDAEGHPGTAFDTGLSGPAWCRTFMASLTGGLFLQDVNCPPDLGPRGQFVASFRSLDPRSSPAPDWLMERPGIELRRIRGGSGYAAIERLGRLPFTCSIEVLTPGGHSCGRVDFGPSVVSSGASASGLNAGANPAPFCSMAVGSDGTVIALTGESDPTGETARWTWHWWPAFFH